ncbi:unnamed protein product, partial [Clonostachys chloroleuca]
QLPALTLLTYLFAQLTYHAPTNARRWQRQPISSAIHILLVLRLPVKLPKFSRHFATNDLSIFSIQIRKTMTDRNAPTTVIRLPSQSKPRVRLIDPDPFKGLRLGR